MIFKSSVYFLIKIKDTNAAHAPCVAAGVCLITAHRGRSSHHDRPDLAILEVFQHQHIHINIMKTRTEERSQERRVGRDNDTLLD